MRSTRYAHILFTLVIVAVAIGVGWFAAIAPRADRLPQFAAIPPQDSGAGLVNPMGRRILPMPIAVTTDVLSQLQPGMSRTEVEDRLGPPSSSSVQPISELNGRTTYRTTYALQGGGGLRRTMFGATPRMFVGLEFDASLPGHPLVNVIYPDPLF